MICSNLLNSTVLNILGLTLNMYSGYMIWKNPIPNFIPGGYGGQSINYQEVANRAKGKKNQQIIGMLIMFIGYIFACLGSYLPH